MASSWWSENTIALVTGANRGIGLEIVRQLAEQGLTVVLTARDRTKGLAAVDGLHAKGLKRVVFHQLDHTDSKSVATLAAWLRIDYGGIDILINNAGTQPSAYDYDAAKYVLDVNYYGVKKVTTSLLTLLRPSPAGARIVNVTSRGGFYEGLQSESIKEILRDEDNYTEKLADSLAARYLDDWKAGRTRENWMPLAGGEIYRESKLFLNVYTNGLAKYLAKSQPEGHEIYVAGMCPGPVATEMMQQAIASGRRLSTSPIKTVEEGADTAVWLALLPKEEWQGKIGRSFGERAEYPFGVKCFG